MICCTTRLTLPSLVHAGAGNLLRLGRRPRQDVQLRRKQRLRPQSSPDLAPFELRQNSGSTTNNIAPCMFRACYTQFVRNPYRC
mmetsp:Transcript_177025/g.567749  ORF Transcript_177025/g.567749 Transcript_177025/m.567749 type:complete len:84 (+) Transcript_177025:938-1189(+)